MARFGPIVERHAVDSAGSFATSLAAYCDHTQLLLPASSVWVTFGEPDVAVDETVEWDGRWVVTWPAQCAGRSATITGADRGVGDVTRVSVSFKTPRLRSA